ncbi:ribonuclease H [Trifolium pratense]|uniref:Ribonuclease H n=1 Tax=Trifolium pratense TaxID=57577 RepID=A0A2K3LBL1_TRIPR|nr:ribonuclease H [Trifolium pratense]
MERNEMERSGAEQSGMEYSFHTIVTERNVSISLFRKAGKETLIKAVAQAIPNYIMSCYKIPEGCCNNIESMLSKFWWGSSENQRKVHWLSWDRMGKSKSKGGLGFRGFSDFNKALLGKQCWRIITDETSLLSSVLKSRYFPKTNFMSANTGHQPSYAWRSLMHTREVIALGMRWSIGNGQQVKIWSDAWIPSTSNFKVWSPIKNLEPNDLVSKLIDVDTKQWKRDLVTNSFNNYEANQILSIPISWRLAEDKRIWN